MPTSHIYATLANEVYQPNGGTPPAGWEFFIDSTTLGLSNNGYYGAAYRNLATNELVIAHRGTNLEPFSVPGGGADLVNDIQLTLGHVPDQFTHSAIPFIAGVKTEFRRQFPAISSPTITYTGHSLGAVLAELSAAQENVAAVTFDSPGSLPIIQEMVTSGVLPANAAGAAQAHVTSYNAAPNLINTTNEHVGTLYRVYPDFSPVAYGEAASPASYAAFTLQQHSMGGILAQFNPSTGEPRLRGEGYTWPVGTGSTGGYQAFFTSYTHNPQYWDEYFLLNGIAGQARTDFITQELGGIQSTGQGVAILADGSNVGVSLEKLVRGATYKADRFTNTGGTWEFYGYGGVDSYHVQPGQSGGIGSTTIHDNDRDGELSINGALLSGTALPVSNHPVGTYLLTTEDGSYKLILKDAATGAVSPTGTDLEIQYTTDRGDNTVVIEGFQSGNFDITLGKPLGQPFVMEEIQDYPLTSSPSAIAFGNGNTLMARTLITGSSAAHVSLEYWITDTSGNPIAHEILDNMSGAGFAQLSNGNIILNCLDNSQQGVQTGVYRVLSPQGEIAAERTVPNSMTGGMMVPLPGDRVAVVIGTGGYMMNNAAEITANTLSQLPYTPNLPIFFFKNGNILETLRNPNNPSSVTQKFALRAPNGVQLKEISLPVNPGNGQKSTFDDGVLTTDGDHVVIRSDRQFLTVIDSDGNSISKHLNDVNTQRLVALRDNTVMVTTGSVNEAGTAFGVDAQIYQLDLAEKGQRVQLKPFSASTDRGYVSVGEDNTALLTWVETTSVNSAGVPLTSAIKGVGFNAAALGVPLSVMLPDEANPVITSGEGKTVMSPGANPTTFAITPSAGAKVTITGFREGQDKIDLSGFGIHEVEIIQAEMQKQAASHILKQNIILPNEQVVSVSNAPELQESDFIGLAPGPSIAPSPTRVSTSSITPSRLPDSPYPSYLPGATPSFQPSPFALASPGQHNGLSNEAIYGAAAGGAAVAVFAVAVAYKYIPPVRRVVNTIGTFTRRVQAERSAGEPIRRTGDVEMVQPQAANDRGEARPAAERIAAERAERRAAGQGYCAVM